MKQKIHSHNKATYGFSKLKYHLGLLGALDDRETEKALKHIEKVLKDIGEGLPR